MSDNKSTKTILDLDENIAGLLCYVLTFISGIVFLVLEKENKFVRFHAMQSTITFGVLFVISTVIAVIPFIGPILSMLINLLGFVLWLLLMYKAFNKEKYKLPVVGDFAENRA